MVLPHEDGLRCWLAREGIARVCADIYEELSHTNAKRDTMHLTNYSLRLGNKWSGLETYA